MLEGVLISLRGSRRRSAVHPASAVRHRRPPATSSPIWSMDGRGEAAAWLRAIARVAARAPKPDLVWSGPEVPGLCARDTSRVYEELLGSAERSIWESTYPFFDGPKAFEVLARRMEVKPSLHVTLLLNIQRKRVTTRPLVRRFADHFWKIDWPGSSRPKVFYDPRALDPEGPGGVLHAKAIFADDDAVFVTSANLTEAALDRNIERRPAGSAPRSTIGPETTAQSAQPSSKASAAMQ
jgi:phosphatidylserine/phosphatidylglycerophosphate/cardiolipin synthase-like enzyme